MRLIPRDPDIRTIAARIEEGSIDLQPDFQRGIVWPLEKQQRLIDSILRDWHVPPIHLIAESDDQQIVLDGQQRLTSIIRFIQDEFPVDGSIAPQDPRIRQLDGLHFSELPKDARRRFEHFPLRIFEIIEYRPEEPYELFYRLNQPTALTSAEQRNAFFGPARDQVKELVELAATHGLTKQTIGFSNSRMSYDDAIARFCIALEYRTLRRKVSSFDITNKYRSGDPFPAEVYQRAAETIRTFLSPEQSHPAELRLNKATLHTWLCFTAKAIRVLRPEAMSVLGYFVRHFELMRNKVRTQPASLFSPERLENEDHVFPAAIFTLLPVFTDRATSRVSDVSSVLLRDLVVWIAYYAAAPAHGIPKSIDHWEMLQAAMGVIYENRNPEPALLAFVEQSKWGDGL